MKRRKHGLLTTDSFDCLRCGCVLLLVEATFSLVCTAITWEVIRRVAMLVSSTTTILQKGFLIKLRGHIDFRLGDVFSGKFDLTEFRGELARVLRHSEVLLIWDALRLQQRVYLASVRAIRAVISSSH